MFDPWVLKIHWRRDRLPTPLFLGFPGGSAGKESACNAGDLGSISGLGRSPGGGHGNQLQYSGLENSRDCIVHGVAESQTQLSDSHPLLRSCIQKNEVIGTLVRIFILPLYLARWMFLVLQIVVKKIII